MTVGSNSNVAERCMAAKAGRAAIWKVNAATGSHRLFATGLRNPDGQAYGRPVGVALDQKGTLLVADDVGNVVWRVSAKAL